LSKNEQAKKLSSSRLKTLKKSNEGSESSLSHSSSSSIELKNAKGKQFQFIDVSKLSSRGALSGIEEKKGSSSSRSNRRLTLDKFDSIKRERNLSISMQKSD